MKLIESPNSYPINHPIDASGTYGRSESLYHQGLPGFSTENVVDGGMLLGKPGFLDRVVPRVAQDFSTQHMITTHSLKPIPILPSHSIDSNRRERKLEELFKIQSFVQECKLMRERVIGTHLTPTMNDALVTRSELIPYSAVDFQQSQRSLSQTEGVENVAELRRNIAEKYATKVASSTPQKTERIISGVFVSYPQKRGEIGSSPVKESPRISSPNVAQDGIISQFRPAVGKMTSEEYAALRQNLLSRSEQHAVSN